MEHISWTTLVCLATLTILIEFAVSLPPEFGDIDTERVVRGKNARNGMFPWTVAIYYESQFICTASIITNNVILTAAHCVVLGGILRDPYSFHATAGDVNRNSPNVEYINFTTITVHPEYTLDLKNDLAIMKTLKPIPLSTNIQPICIASPNIESLDNKNVIAMGWGGTSRKPSNQVFPDILQYAQQRVISNSRCSTLYAGVTITDNNICARGVLSGICEGDSGGPLVYVKRKKSIQVGVASFTNSLIGCGRFRGPGGFTRLSVYTKFIMENAGNSVCLEN